jgi:pyruvate dehydrogenase E2 component (dihydrolipoamide acetyltransferase)
MADFKLPDLGEGVTEAEIDRWLVAEGDPVSEDEPLVEVITDKATVEIPSPFSGAVSRIHVPEGTTVPVGTVLVTIAGDDGVVEASRDTGAHSSGEGAPAAASSAPSERSAPERAARDDVRAMPPVRRLARSLGVNLGRVTGSGPGGQILREDVEAAARPAGGEIPAAATADTATPASRDEGDRSEPLRGVRRTIAERMALAHRSIPAVTHVEECDVTELDATRRLANDRTPSAPRLTYLPFIVKAVVAGLKQHPVLNASLDEDAAAITYHSRFDIGVAVDTPAGLTVPVVRDADKQSLRELARSIDRLAQGARDQTLAADELRGGTFTITSPGAFGGVMATPIILPPQVGILGVHRATERPVVRDGRIVVRKIMNLSLTFDHRALDGMTAARFALDVVKLLEHPAVLALED